MTIQFPSTKSLKDSIRQEIGQTATFILANADNKVACPRCLASGYYDEINDASLDVWCPVCSGVYWQSYSEEISAIAHVRWLSSDIMNYGSAGYTLDGDVVVTVSIDDVSDEQAQMVREIVIDNRTVAPNKIMLRGVPTRDRVRFVCKQIERA